MANYGSCINWVLRLEDSILSGKIENLGDGAGLTRFGITSVNDNWIDPEFWGSMPRDAALEIATQVYHDKYWNLINGLQIVDDEVAATLLSFAVNDGVRQAIREIQRIVGVPDDGVSGSITIAAINQACAVKGAPNVAQGLREAQEAYYEAVLARKPQDEKFRNGWMNRARARYPDLSY